MNGYLLIDKPKGWTSFDAVNKTRFLVADTLNQSARKIKVGHAGTLDPNATGLLIILVGDYTKRQAEFMKLDKTYWAEVILGANSDTDDIDGQLTPVKVTRKPNRTQIESVLLTQVGQLLQLPPKYSAIKQGGQKAYELARKGKIVDLKPRPVIVYSISDIEYDWPYLAFRANVSSGTYIRSIARDVGSKLKTGAYLSQLRRETIGDFSLADAITIEKLELAGPAEHLKQS